MADNLAIYFQQTWNMNDFKHNTSNLCRILLAVILLQYIRPLLHRTKQSHLKLGLYLKIGSEFHIRIQAILSSSTPLTKEYTVTYSAHFILSSLIVYILTLFTKIPICYSTVSSTIRSTESLNIRPHLNCFLEGDPSNEESWENFSAIGKIRSFPLVQRAFTITNWAKTKWYKFAYLV